MHTCTHKHAYTHTHLHTCMRSRVPIYSACTHTFSCTYALMHTYSCTHSCIHTQSCTHTHVHTWPEFRFPGLPPISTSTPSLPRRSGLQGVSSPLSAPPGGGAALPCPLCPGVGGVISPEPMGAPVTVGPPPLKTYWMRIKFYLFYARLEPHYLPPRSGQGTGEGSQMVRREHPLLLGLWDLVGGTDSPHQRAPARGVRRVSVGLV